MCNLRTQNTLTNFFNVVTRKNKVIIIIEQRSNSDQEKLLAPFGARNNVTVTTLKTFQPHKNNIYFFYIYQL